MKLRWHRQWKTFRGAHKKSVRVLGDPQLEMLIDGQWMPVPEVNDPAPAPDDCTSALSADRRAGYG